MQNTSTSRSTDFRRQKTITSKTPLTLYGRGFCASDGTPTTTGSPAGPQSNQNVWVLPPISRNGLSRGFHKQSTFWHSRKCHFPRKSLPNVDFRQELHFRTPPQTPFFRLSFDFQREKSLSDCNTGHFLTHAHLVLVHFSARSFKARGGLSWPHSLAKNSGRRRPACRSTVQ